MRQHHGTTGDLRDDAGFEGGVPAGVPGKRSLTMGLAPRPGGAPAASAAGARVSEAPDLRRLLDDALRPDLACAGVGKAAPVPDGLDAAAGPPMDATDLAVTIATVRGPAYHGQGTFLWMVMFALGAPAPADGWIVQHVQLTRIGAEVVAEQFWEAWPVKAGQLQPPPAANGGCDYHDAYCNGGASDRGAFHVTGTVAFYTGALPPAFRAGGVETAGTAHASASAPSFWNGAGTDHSVDLSWDPDGLKTFSTAPACAVTDLSKMSTISLDGLGSSSDDDDDTLFGSGGSRMPIDDLAEEPERPARKPVRREKPAVPPGEPEVLTSPVLEVQTMGGTWRIINRDYLEPSTATYAQSDLANKHGGKNPTKTTPIGVKAHLQFTPNDTVDATAIGLTQTVSHYANDALVNQGPREGLTVGGSKDRSDTKPTTIGGGKGTLIDKHHGNVDPIYAAKPPTLRGTEVGGNLADPYLGQYGYARSEPKEMQCALLLDEPLDAAAREVPSSGQVFETTALAMDGAQTGTYYGSVRWGWKRHADGTFEVLPLTVVSMGVPSATFMRAAELWNAGSNHKYMKNVPLPTSALPSPGATMPEDLEARLTVLAMEDQADPNVQYEIAVLRGRRDASTSDSNNNNNG